MASIQNFNVSPLEREQGIDFKTFYDNLKESKK